VDLGLNGKVALVGASSKGLGRASAFALAREGARVTVCARSQDTLDATAAEIREATGAEILAVAADLNTAAGIDSVVAATAERFGTIDILINNSGGPGRGKFDDLTDADWLAGFEAVTLNFVRFVRGVLPYMRANGWGRIISIQSSSVKQPVPGLDLSNGTRPGIAGLMKAMMPDLAAQGITINLVLPGSFRTDRIGAGHLAPYGHVDGIPVPRFGEPEELGNLVAFLASGLTGYITGAAYQIDGGGIRSNL